MKICFYCDSVFSFGGVQRVLAEIVRGLAEVHEVTILTSDDPALENRALYDLSSSNIRFQYIRYPRLPFYEYYPCKAYSLFYKKILPKNKLTTRLYAYSSFSTTYRKLLSDILNKGHFDLIVGVHVYPSLYLGAIKKRVRVPMIGWLHNSFDAFFHQPGVWLWKAEQRFRYQMRFLDKVVVLTQADREFYQREMGLQTITIYNPLSLVPHGKGHEGNKKFLSVGRFVPRHKGFDILIRAFAEFARHDSEWTLDIVGEGPEESFYRRLIAENHLEDRITIYPFTKNIQKYYEASSVYVLSSRWEGFGLVWIEAMAHGLPVIASDLPVVKELLKDSGNVLMFKNKDMIDLSEKMLDITRRGDLEQMGDISCQVADRFRLPEILRQWEVLFSECLVKQ